MGLPFVRPRVAELLFRLYDRPLHPELFDVLVARTVKRDGYTLSVRLTRTGHALGWTDGRVHLEEVTATAEMELPETGRRLGHGFDGNWGGRCVLGGGVRHVYRLTPAGAAFARDQADARARGGLEDPLGDPA